MKGRKEMKRTREKFEVRRQKLVALGVALVTIVFASLAIKMAYDHSQKVTVIDVHASYEPRLVEEVGGAQALCDMMRRVINRNNALNEERGNLFRQRLVSCRPLAVLREPDWEAHVNYEQILMNTNFFLGTDFVSDTEEPVQMVSIREDAR